MLTARWFSLRALCLLSLRDLNWRWKERHQSHARLSVEWVEGSYGGRLVGFHFIGSLLFCGSSRHVVHVVWSVFRFVSRSSTRARAVIPRGTHWYISRVFSPCTMLSFFVVSQPRRLFSPAFKPAVTTLPTNSPCSLWCVWKALFFVNGGWTAFWGWDGVVFDVAACLA